MAKRQIVSIQVLRGLAACGVVCHHAFHAVTINPPPNTILPPPLLLGNHTLVEVGASGVDIFFVLSGFLMIYISGAYSSGGRSIWHFLSQRLIRVWPLYALATGIYCLSMARHITHGGPLPYDLQPFRLASFFFIPSFSPLGLVHPILDVGWTLNYEVFFYLCFAVTLAVTRKHLLLMLAAILLLFHVVGLFLPSSSAVAVFLSNNIIFEFLFGAIVGLMSKLDRLPWPRPGIWLGAGALLLVLAASTPNDLGFRALTRGIPAAAILIGMIHLEGRIAWPKLALLLGNASYSIYLFHILIIYRVTGFLFPLLQHRAPSMAAEAIAAVAIPAAVAGGVLCYKYIEKPLLAWCHLAYARIAEAPLQAGKASVPLS